MAPQVEVTVELGDITTIKADVIAIKYAQAFHGADAAVAKALGSVGVSSDSLRPRVGQHRYVATKGATAAPHALFVGVPELYHLTYDRIREFAALVLRALKSEAPSATHLAMTIHGPGFGLDEVESCLEQVEGYREGIRSGEYPPSLQRITIVDRDRGRVDRLRKALAEKGIALDVLPASPSADTRPHSQRAVRPAGTVAKPHAFVAMPFGAHMGDIYHYGIQASVHAADLLCERMDHVAFTGEIIEWMKRKIETATVVIAELSGANPNVYLEIGYAWGKGRPTILLAPQVEELAFDVRGHRCLLYQSIQDLEQVLSRELGELRARKLL